ncbi:MAG TPA: RNA polymerase sigma factor [Casimicrobiaceae bacterium]|nr:RNA polymerase sigma factor [Casimicrobiaceae bacterium]
MSDAPGDDDDQRLMLAYARGDAAAFDALYARHRNGVYRYLLRHCNNAGTADELFQDVWMNVIRSRNSYAPTARFATWLYTLAHNRIVDHWRSTGQAKLVSTDADEAAGAELLALAASRGDQPDVRVLTGQIRQRLNAALTALPPAQRDAFLLQQESGLSLAEIGALTGVGIETVKSRLRYAAARLRTALIELREASADEH